MSAVGHPPNISMLPNLVNRYAICTVPALDLHKNGFLSVLFYGNNRLLHFNPNTVKCQYHFPVTAVRLNFVKVYFFKRRKTERFCKILNPCQCVGINQGTGIVGVTADYRIRTDLCGCFKKSF